MAIEEAQRWVPHGARNSEYRAAELSELVEDFPEWLEPSVVDWLRGASIYLEERRTERMLRVSLTESPSPYLTYWSFADDDARVEFLDFVLHEAQLRSESVTSVWGAQATEQLQEWGKSPESHYSQRLEQILAEGGSVWRVVRTPHWALERRASESARTLVELVEAGGTDAGKALASAWHACYRPSPDYSKAYRDAVLAVEACTLPVTTPKDAVGTLGKAAAHIRDTSARWTVGGLSGSRHSGDTLVAMLETLWQGQQRHAGPDGKIADVTKAEAEAALSLAVSLVHWFTAGLVMKSLT